IGLVILVIFLFLRSLWATVIPSITIPLSLLATFAAMALCGFTLDNLSLMALTISVGFVVDDAIVVVENIVRHIEMGKKPVEAAIEGGGQVAFTIVSITVSLVAVFIPVFFMGGIVGRLFREFGITVSVAILASAMVSLTLSPMLCGRLMRARSPDMVEARPGRVTALAERAYERLIGFYRWSLDWVLRHQKTTLAGFAMTLALTIALYIVIPKGFFPPQDVGRIYGFGQASADTPFKTTQGYVTRIAALIRSDPDIYSVTSYVGADGGENTGLFVINLKPRDQRTNDARAVMARLRKTSAAVPGMQLFMQPEPEIVTGTDFGRSEYLYQLIDADRAELKTWLPVIEQRMKQIPGLIDVSREQEAGVPSARVVVDRELAARLGVDSQAVDDTLYDAYGARRVAEIFTDVSQYYAILAVDPKFQVNAESLSLIHVASRDGRQVPLGAFAHVLTATADVQVAHHGQFPVERISFNLARGVSLGEAVERIHAMERELGKPVGLQTSFEGTARDFEESLASEPWLIAAATLVVYIVLGILYESFRHPLTIISSLPSAGVGALLALMVTGQPLDVMGLIGILLLIGIVKKNAIMMVDFAVKAEREGLAPLEAIREACLVRFRPIMMTTVAALFGALPLALGGGAGAELRHPLGIAIVGGLMLSQVLTLYSTPVIHLALGALAERLRWPQRRTVALATPAE
ncbi:MAG TPA: efflux RND transporter permease subunit, partial [Stellaceae bacterium]|nr:efflux RND transporter permease subunit [Stellaceae bacterium]